ncbi:flagellin [Candidatus Bathyarchaeota archaeon]|nr:flagellin [Candidatus Bathyarchaeota archaeon]
MIINHNLSAINANRVLGVKYNNVDKSMEKLASGLRINRGGDDASGLAVSEKLRSQIRGLHQASRNIQSGVSFIQTAEGYLQESSDVIQRLRELAVQSSNGIYTPEDRFQIQIEVNQLVDEVNRVASHAQFNGMNILTGRFAEANIAGEGTTMFFHVGANMDQREVMFIGTMTATALKMQDITTGSFMSLSTASKANAAIGILDEALKLINKQRADLGGYQNRFEMAKVGVDIAAENFQAAESVLRDTDMASQLVEYIKDTILVQAGTAMLAQANTKPQTVLQLLG